MKKYVIRSDSTGEFLTGLKTHQIRWVSNIEDARVYHTREGAKASLGNQKILNCCKPIIIPVAFAIVPYY